jgi:ribosomal protein S18 acetylase RimI-like enzyme
MTTSVRLCRPEDAERLSGLMAQFRDEFGLTESDDARARAVAPLLDGSPYGMAYLLGPSNAPVGYVIVTLGWGVELGGLEAWIDEIFIRPPVRGRGIATEILIEIGRMLVKAGAKAIHLEVKRTDDKVQALYQRAGFALRGDYCLMTRKL